MAVIPSSLRMVKAGTGATGNSRTLTWLVKSDSPTDSTSNIYASAVVPKRWDAPPAGHDIPDGFVCWTSDVQPRDDSLYWFIITAEYITPPLNIFPTPLAYVAKGGGGPDVWEDTDYDAAGAPIVNTADDYVDPPFQKPASGGSFWVEFRTTNIDNWGLRSYKVNSDTLFGLAAGLVRTGKIEWFRGIEDGVRFWQIRVPFDYKPEGWRVEWESRGFNYLDGSNKMTITLADGERPNIPQPLDSAGAVAASTSAAEVITTTLYEEMAMSGWGMPNPFDLDD